MLPTDPTGQLTELSVAVLARAAALGSLARPELRRPLAAALRQMNGYYSNLIEGHETRPVDVERAMRRDFSADPAQRALQQEGLAHVEVQALIDAKLKSDPATDPCAPAFLGWIHQEFYQRLPETFRWVEDRATGVRAAVEPGRLRERPVAVGAHVAPGSEALPRLLARFQEAYRPDRLRGTEQVIAAAASHHRLTWIHPFLDGNGRVARLFTHAYLARIGVGGHGLWTVTRGLARDQQAYLAALAAADAQRQGDLDGRGNLSNRTLVAFCRFFLGAALDQIDFMSGLLELGALERRVAAYSERLVAQGLVRREATLLLRDVLVRGEVARGEAGRITGTGERVARQIVASLTARRLLESETPKGPVHLGFPAEAVPYYFPRLYPAGVEMGAEERGGGE